MNEELGNIQEGEFSVIEKKEYYSRLMLNIKVSRGLLSAVSKLNTNYDDVCAILIANLLAKGKIGYSRDKSITEPKKYNKKGISNYRIIRAIDCLSSLGLVDNYIAIQSFNNDYVKDYSHIEATPLLIDMFGSFKYVKESKKSFVQDRQCVILKDSTGKKIDYKDTTYTIGLRSKLSSYNVFASSFTVECKGKELSTTLDAHHKHSLNDYGRLFGADYQTIPKTDRKDTTINKKNIIEIDYSCLHFRMLLDMYLLSHHVNPQDDLYLLPLCNDNEIDRSLVKMMFNMIVNTTSKAKAIAALQGEINLNRLPMGSFKQVKDIYQCLEDCYPYLFNNPAIMGNIYSGLPLAATLQKRESAIATDIITTCQQLGFLVCPVHDSFTADASNAYLLAKIIGDCYRKEMNTSAGVSVSVILGDKTWKQIV